MKMTHICYDIETTGADDSVLDALTPEFSAPSNYTKPEAIKKYIDAAIESWKDKAALSAITGKILCIGLSENFNACVLDGDGDEASLLREFWSHLDSVKEETAGAFIAFGYNTHSFDLPMLCRRSWLNGITIPAWIRRGRYFHDAFIDLREVWQLGDRNESTGGLNGLAKAFGCGEKLGSGKHFGKLWNEDREAALAYALQDIALTEAIAMKMGVIQPRSQEPVIQSDETDDFDY